MDNGPFIGRRETIGVGIEATAGTAVAAQGWQRFLKLALDPKTTVAQNNSAMGRIEDINDSAVTEEWAEGSINGKVTDLLIGYFLLNMFGSVAATAHGAESTVYDNTFSVGQTAVPPTLTFVRSNPIVTRAFAFGMLTDLELDVDTAGYAMFTATITTKAGTTTSATAALVDEHEFTSKHTVVKLANDTSGLSAATALQLKSLKLKMSRKADRFTPFGTIDPAAFDINSWGSTGELVLRYTDTTLEALGNANTRQAMSIALTNTDATIGDSSNPALVFTAPKVRLSPLTLDDNLDQPLNQTIDFTCELDTVAGYMLQAVLTNTQNGYIHA